MSVTKTLYWWMDHCDKSCPCDASLEGWARWIASPEGQEATGIVDGAEIRLSSAQCVYREVALTDEDGWSPEPPSCDWLAVAFGPGLGWAAQGVAYDAASLAELLDPGVYWLACISELGVEDVKVRFRAGGGGGDLAGEAGGPRLELIPESAGAS